MKHYQTAVAVAIWFALIIGIPTFLSPAEAKTSITVWSILNPAAADPRSKAFKAVVDGFMAENPDIEVKVEVVNYGKRDVLLIQAEAAGGGPDVIATLFSADLTQHARSKSVAALNPYMESWYAKNKGDFPAPEGTEFDGNVIGLRWELRNNASLWYRQDLLERVGTKAPQTLQELASVARKVASDRVHGFLVGMSEGMLGKGFVEQFEPVLWVYGGSLLDGKGKPTFNSAAGEKAMQWITDLVKVGAMGKSAVSMNSDDVFSGFKAGTVAMAFQATSRVSAAREGQGIGWNLRTAPMPSLEPGKPGPASVVGQSVAMGANSKNKDAAWRFIEYFLSAKPQLLFAKAGVAPVRRSVYSDPYFQTPEGREALEWKEHAEKYGRIGRYPEDFAKLSELLARAAQEVVMRNVLAKEALDDAAAKYEAQVSR